MTGAVVTLAAALKGVPTHRDGRQTGLRRHRSNWLQVQATQRLISDALAEGAAQAAGIDAYADKGYYFLEYPEDIQLFGVSFSTELGASGWALQGEYSYRRDAPLQFAERKVFADALAPFTGLPGCIAGHRREVPWASARAASPSGGRPTPGEPALHRRERRGRPLRTWTPSATSGAT